MESYITSEHGTEDIYMIQGSAKFPHLALTPLNQFGVMDNEGAPEFVVDQGLYYPGTTNYYPYYCTGYQSNGEWDDNHRFFGLDTPNLHYSGVQTDSLPYVYYTPNYGYAQSSFNPYNPYIPGAVIGVDGSYVGMQQYCSGSSYQQPVPPAFYPLVVQPIVENIPNNAGSYVLNAGAANANGSDASGIKLILQPASDVTAKVPPKPALVEGDKRSNQPHSSCKRSEIPKTQVENNKHLAKHTSVATMSVSHSASSQVTQGRNASGSVQGTDKLIPGQASSLRALVKVAVPVTNASPEFGTNARGWPMVDNFRPRVPCGGTSNNENGNADNLTEQNRGPRTNRSRGQWSVSTSGEVEAANSGTPSSNGNIIFHADEYNREDFPVSYVDGKFFVIKSYSEDDVHKSIKYIVWSSTPNGNKRLSSAYEDAQRRAAGSPGGCPVFLFFSVNASGQFCGVAEMIGPVDFNKDMNFWQQDKWSGSFPVKWHIIKDVQNTNFRHIILENNDNKPVTNSRDTQEIKYRQGIEMLKIFKKYTLKSSILDDFFYYEERQNIMQEEKARVHGKDYDRCLYIPAFVPPKKSVCVADQPGIYEVGNMLNCPSSSGKVEQASIKSDVPNSLSSEEGSTKHNSVEDENGITAALRIGSLSVDKVPVDNKPAATQTNTGAVDVSKVGSKCRFANSSSSVDINSKHTSVEGENVATYIGNVANNAKPGGTKFAAAVRVATASTVDVFTVGSMPVMVNGFLGTSGVLTQGSIPIVHKE